MKVIASIMVLLFGVATSIAFAGVAPNTGASAAARSGARIAPPKPAPSAPAQEEAASPSSTEK